ncbi:MAG: hypothetical protein SOR75_02165 [Synergistes jonesii]|nr:hypothetical protein [Synergistes jonesii]MDY2984115.1 hypothetical protein [Synergistes jonesii]
MDIPLVFAGVENDELRTRGSFFAEGWYGRKTKIGTSRISTAFVASQII